MNKDLSSVNEFDIVANDLEKVFLDFWRRPKVSAVKGISFSIKKGEVFGLLGPNGSGKSTTIKMLLGLLKPTRGSVKIFNQSSLNRDVKQKIGYLPELSYLYKYLTPRETLRYYAGLFNFSKCKAEERIEELLHMLNITDVADRPVGEFSKGMSRRVCMAQSLLNDPDLIIFDEPTSGLDPIGRYDVKNMISQFSKQGKTILLSSHLLSEIEDVCDRVMIMSKGEIIEEGILSDILKVDGVLNYKVKGIDSIKSQQILEFIKSQGGVVDLNNDKISLERYFINTLEKEKYCRGKDA